jgi:hypothetical protein
MFASQTAPVFTRRHLRMSRRSGHAPWGCTRHRRDQCGFEDCDQPKPVSRGSRLSAGGAAHPPPPASRAGRRRLAPGNAIRGYTSDALDAIRSYSWPWNVRELSNRVRRAVVMAERREITARDLDLPGEAAYDEGDALASLRAAQRRIEIELFIKGISLHRGELDPCGS